jgi:hypothetical protein
MAKTYTLRLEPADCLQILDALTSRAEAYERTMSYLKGEISNDCDFVIEECRDENEAAEITKHFRDIQHNSETQIAIGLKKGTKYVLPQG